MDWSKGFTTSFYACLVDPVTWTDIERFEIEGGNVNRAETGLRGSADISHAEFDYGSDKWIRIWMETEQGGAHGKEALFTGMTSVDESEISGANEIPIECYSVLKAVDDVDLPRGWYAAKGFKGSEILKRLLSVGPAPVVIQGESARLSQHIIAEDNETHLTMADSILDAIGWRMFIRGDGTIVAGPPSDEPVHTFGYLQDDSIELPVKIKHDRFDCPNVLRAMTDDASAVVRDEDPASELSITERGREVWHTESSVKLSSGETLFTYAKKRLKELQETAVEMQYDRTFNPEINVSDAIRFNYPKEGLEGVFRVTSQKIALDAAGTTSEGVRAI